MTTQGLPLWHFDQSVKYIYPETYFVAVTMFALQMDFSEKADAEKL